MAGSSHAAKHRSPWLQLARHGVVRALSRAALLGLFAVSPVVQADWASITPQELARSAEIIVTGEYLGQQNQVQLPGATEMLNIGVIRVEQWFKAPKTEGNAHPSLPNLVLLVAPLPRANGTVSSVDVPLKAGQQGLWYLRKQGKGLYRIDRPDRFVSADSAKAAEHLKLLQALPPISAAK